MKKKSICAQIFTMSALLIFGMTSAHADSYTCAKTFRVVNTGDSMEAVQAACGEPTASSVRTDTVNTPMEVLRWFYLLLIDPKKPSVPLFSVSFREGKAVQIEKSDLLAPLAGAYPCLMGGMLKLGLTTGEVMAMCGQPSSMSVLEISVPSSKPVVVWLYDMGQFQPKIQFEFEDAKLARIKRN
jgi:hypothetical protein